MTKFKIGDRVIRVRDCINYHSSPFFLGIESWEILHIEHDEFNQVLVKDPNGSWHNEYCLGLCSPEKEDKLKALDVEAAKAILEAQGYTVTPPRHKRKGQLFIYYSGGEIRSYNVEQNGYAP